jgi:RNA polymerase sigma-70 factor (ECF subfamily)
VSNERDDHAFVVRFLRTHDEATFREIYRRHASSVYAFVRRFVGATDPEITDLAQDVWIRAVAALPRFAWRSTLRTWLLGIAVNRCREYLRERGSAQPECQDLTADGERVLYHCSQAAIDRLDLEQLVSALPLGYREVLVLHDIQGHTHEEIAQILGLTVGTSKSQLSRARRALRTAFGSQP